MKLVLFEAEEGILLESMSKFQKNVIPHTEKQVFLKLTKEKF